MPRSKNVSSIFGESIREFCVVLFGQICAKWWYLYLTQLYDMLYWGKTIVGLYLGYLETTQNPLKSCSQKHLQKFSCVEETLTAPLKTDWKQLAEDVKRTLGWQHWEKQ